MRKLLLIFVLLFLSISYVFTVNSFATEASYGDGSYSFANHAARSNGRQDCWMSASKDNEKLTLWYGGNNYDAHITEKGVFQIVSNGDGTVSIKYNGRILVGDSSTFAVKLLPEATSSNLEGSKWKITSAGMQGTCWIEWVGPNSGTGAVLATNPVTGEFVVSRPNGSNAMWDIYRVDKNIVFQEQFHAYSFNFWNKVLGSLNFPGVSVYASANSSEYNINKKLNSFDYRDYTLEGKVKPKVGTAGLLFRNDGTNMYLWSLDRTSKLAELFSINIATGQRTKLKSKSFTVSSDIEKWYNIKISVKDNKMVLFIDDVFVDFAEDNTTSRGLIGYWVGGTATASGTAEFDNILVKKETQQMWYKSKDSVHNKFKDADGKVITITDDTDINTLDIPSLGTSNFWEPFVGNFNIPGGTRVERFLFTTSIDVPENVSNVVISGDGTSTITIDDRLALYVNGRRVAYGLASNVQSIIIEKKYLMPGSKNDILLVLSDTDAGEIKLSRLKVTTNVDSSYISKNIIEYNGFKIQYDESNPINSKIIKYPSNIMIDGIQMNAADTPVFDESGRIKQAYFNAILTGPVYKYNGWHKCQKIFSTKPESSININLIRGYGGSSYAVFNDVIFEQAKFDIFDMGENISSVQAIVNQDESLSIRSDAIFEIFGEQEDCSLSINIKDNYIYVGASSRFLLDGYLSASKKMVGYDQISDISLSGGFNYDIFRKKVTDDYDISINTYDGAKVRLTIPKFGELSFSELTMNAEYITARNLGFTFADDCIFEGLKTSQDQKCTVEFKSLTINKEASSLKDLIKACELKVTLKQDVEVFGGLNIKAVNSKTGKQTVFTGEVKEGNFSFMFDGTLELPDDAKTQIETKFWVDTDGNFMVDAKGELENGLNIKGINLTATPGSSKVGFRFQSAVYKDNILESPRKCAFEFENVGTTLNIPGAGNVIFTIKEFALTDNGIEDIKGGIGGSVSLFNDNMIIDAANDGITLAYNSSDGWTVKAADVMVKFPNVGDNGMACKASFDMNSITGLGTIKCNVPSLTLFKEFVSITDLEVDVYKAPDTGKYTMTISAGKLICNVKKVLPLENDTTIGAENVTLTVADLSNPSVSLNLDKLEYNRRIEFNMGLKVVAEGIAFYFNDKKVEVVKPTFTLPKDIPGIKFYKAADMKEEVTDPVVQVDYIRAIFGSSWGFEVGGAKLPGACVYNLFNMNICKITLLDLYAGYNSNKFNISVKSASVTVASGYSAELTDVKITNDDVSIGGGSITIPEINIGGIGINNLMATFGTETIGDKDYSIFGGACSITIPGLGAIGGSLKVQNYSDNFFGLIKEASFELTLAQAVPLGTTGLSLKMVRGSLTRGELPANFPGDFRFMFGEGPKLKIVSMGLGLVDTTSGGAVLKAGADVWVELNNWGFALDANATIFEGFVQAKAGVAYANNIFAARAQVRVLCIEGRVVFYVYPFEGKTTMSGEGTVAVKLEKGKILNKKIWRWRIRIPGSDIWYDGISAQFGRFTNGKVGFQVGVRFPVLGKMSAFVGDGGLKFFTNYSIYVPKVGGTTQTASAANASQSNLTTSTASSISAINLSTKSLLESGITPAVKSPISATGVALVTATGTSSTSPVFTDLNDSNGKKIGTRIEFNNQDTLEKIVLSASCDKSVPNITISLNGMNIPLTHAAISTDTQEVNEVIEVNDELVDTGKIGVSTLLGIDLPLLGTADQGKGNWVIEVRCEEDVDLAFITKLSDPELVINSASFDGGNNKLTVTGQVKQYTAGEQNVTLIMKNAPKTDGDNVMPGERIVATSKNLQDMDGIKSITIGGDGKFTVVIDTTIMRSGTYNLLAELDRKVVLSKDGDLFETEGGSEDFTSGEEYKENGTIKKFEIINNTMNKVPKPDVFVTCYGTEPTYMYNLDVNFKSTTESADGYMIFADCYVGGVYKGTRKINIGNMTKARIGQFTEYLSVTDGEASYKPTMLSVYIVPYKYIDKSKGFIYDFGGNLGFETISNNITLGPESDKVDVWLERSTSNTLASVTSGMASPVEIPVEGSTKGKIIINTLDNTLDKSKILVQVKSVTKSNVDLGSKSLLGDAISVKLGDDSVDAVDYITPTAAGAYNFNLSLFANVDAAQAKAMADANTPLSVTLSVYNSSNPSNYKEITIPFKFTLPTLSLKSINQDTFSSMTGGVLDVYGTQLLKGCIVKLVDSANVEQTLEIIPEESGIGRIAVKIPQGIAVGEYTLKVIGPVLATGTTNTQIWSEKIKIIKSDFEWVKVRDTGKIEKGTTGKFYARLDSKTGFKGTAGIKAKSSSEGFIVQLNKNQVAMGENIEAVITVPSTAADNSYNIEFEACSLVDNAYASAYSYVGSFVVTVTSSEIATDISSVSNKRVSPGDVFDIYGEGFTSQTSVEITTPSGSVKTLNIVSRTENKLTVSVPYGSLSGDLRTRNGSIYSPTSVPFTVVPPEIVPNFETAPISVILVPGETTYIDVNNNGKPVLTSSQAYLVTSADSQGKVKITVPASTKPGEYYAYARVMYPNTTIEKKIVVYVVDDGNAAEDLSRQVILSGRNLYIKVKGANVSSIQNTKLEVNGNSITRTPVKVGDEWTIDVGMVNGGTIVKYQFNYVINGASFTTPIYEYKVEYQNPENTDNLYKVKLFEMDNNDVLLKVNVISPFNPDTMSITYKKGNEAEVKVPMVKNGDNWEVNLGKLVEDSKLIYSLSYGSGVDTVTSVKKELSYKTKNPANSQLEYSFTRDSATGRVKLNLTGLKVDNKDIIPTTVKVTLNDVAGGTSKTYDMVKNGNVYQADIGDINNATRFNIKYEYTYEGERYKAVYKSVKYNESTYPDSNNGFVSEYFDSKYFSESRLTTVDPVVDFDFKNKAPAGGLVSNSTYSMRWSGKLQARYGEEHTFYLTVPNGKATLWVDGKLIADGKGSLNGKCTLAAGKPTDIVVEYATDGSGAIKLEWQSANQTREVVPQSRVIAVASSKPCANDFAPFATQVAYDMIAIGWNTPNVTGVSYYEVYEGTSLISTLWGVKSFTRTGLATDTDYTYRIKAYNSSKILLAESTSLVVRTERAPMDLALNKSTTASSTLDAANAAKFAVDGDSCTNWTSNSGDNQWIRVDLGREYEIVKVRLNWREDSHAKYYKIQVSNDDTAWMDVYSTITGDGGIDEIRLSSVKARYVRMKASLSGISSNSYSLMDFNVYGYAYSPIKTLFYNQIIDAQNNNITPTFKIINTGTENVDLNTLKLRYYYTVDKDVPQVFECDWTPISPNVTGKFVKMNSPKNNADYYLEVGFQTTTPMLKPGENVEVKARFHRGEWTAYTQTNDYSFDRISKEYVDNSKITVYQSGNIIQGMEP